MFNQAISHLDQAVNGTDDKHVQETPQLTNATIEWVPLHNLPVPGFMSDVRDTPTVSHSRIIVFLAIPPVAPVVAQPPVPTEARRYPAAQPVASVSLNVSAYLRSVPPFRLP